MAHRVALAGRKRGLDILFGGTIKLWHSDCLILSTSIKKQHIMKKHILRLIALLMFASAVSSCSVEYREHHHWHHDDHYRSY